MLAGIKVGVVTTFVNLAAFPALLPHSDKYATLTLSPDPATVTAAALLVKRTTILCELTSPESMVALAPNVPVNDHNQPVAGAAVAVATGNAGAE